MTRKSLFLLSASTAFLSVTQIAISKEIARAQKDIVNNTRRRRIQQAAERLLHER